MIHLPNAVIRTTNIVDARKTMTMMSQVPMMNPALVTILLILHIITVLKLRKW
jgi:hypothetical protein